AFGTDVFAENRPVLGDDQVELARRKLCSHFRCEPLRIDRRRSEKIFVHLLGRHGVCMRRYDANQHETEDEKKAEYRFAVRHHISPYANWCMTSLTGTLLMSASNSCYGRR